MNKKLIIITLLCGAHILIFGAEADFSAIAKAPTRTQLLQMANAATVPVAESRQNLLATSDSYANTNARAAQTALIEAGINANIVREADFASLILGTKSVRDVQPFAILALKDGRSVCFSRDDRGSSMAAILPPMAPIITLPKEFKGSLYELGDSSLVIPNRIAKVPVEKIVKGYEIPLTVEELSVLCGGKTVKDVLSLLIEIQGEDKTMFDMCAKAIKDSKPQCQIQ